CYVNSKVTDQARGSSARLEVRGQRTEDRGQRTEDSGQRTEDRGQRTADSGNVLNDSTAQQLNRGLAAREPGVFLPESLEKRVVAAENVALGFTHVRNADRKRAARTQSAFSIAGVLPKVPMSPGRRVTRLVV